MTVSVVVPTRNSAATLEACLLSILAQTVPVELIVIDNYSSDGTPAIAQRLAAVFRQAGPERSRQRNLGAQLSQGRQLFFIDSDMILPATCAAECLEQAEAGFKAVIVPEVSTGQGFWAACKALERACYVGDDSIEAARFIDRSFFDQLGGFDEGLTGEEDWDLTARIRARGVTIARTQTPLVHDEGRLKLSETVRTKFYYGRTMVRYMGKHPGAARAQLSLFRPAFVRHADLLRADPAHAGGMVLMKTCEMAGGALGAAVGWLRDRRR